MECSNCLLTSQSNLDVLEFFWPGRGLTVELAPDGPCSFCRDVAAYLDEDELAAERDQFFERATRPIFLAYSGGKDSTAALYHLRRELDLPVVAVLFDNGYIPSEVIDYAKRVCARLDAELIVDRQPPGKERLAVGFSRRLKVAFRGVRNDVCTACSKTFMSRFHRLVIERGSDSIVLGNNFWTHSPHTSGHSDPPTMRATWDKTLLSGEVVHNINLPFASRITYARTQEILEQVGFHEVSFSGYTTNCVLSDFQDHVRERDGQTTDWGREYLSLEVSSGYITREEALAKLGSQVRGPDPELMRRIEATLTTGAPLGKI